MHVYAVFPCLFNDLDAGPASFAVYMQKGYLVISIFSAVVNMVNGAYNSHTR
jgi:hypothetical protein